MRSQRVKDIYFLIIRPISKLNAWFWSLRHAPRILRANKAVFLNLGCGERYLEGFVNIEGNIRRKKDIWLDIRNGLPFPDRSVDGIYSCHVFEHFYMDELQSILKECHRVAKPGGGIRVLVPSLEQAITAYAEGRRDWFPDFPASYKSLGGRFFNFVFCDSQHRLVFDFSFLSELLEEAGFTNFTPSKPGESKLFPSDLIKGIEHDEEHHIRTSLIVEAISSQ